MKIRVSLVSGARGTDDRHTIDPDRDVLTSLPALFSKRTYVVGRRRLVVKANWRKYARRPERPKDISIRLDVAHVPRRSGAEFAADLAEVYLSELFLVANVASPGVISNFDAVLETLDPQLTVRRRLAQMDGYVFDRAWWDSIVGTPPPVGSLAVGDVLAWFDRLQIGSRQIAVAPIEKALFNTLHACRLAALMEPSAILSLAQAMEALYRVPTALSFSFLTNRVASLFNLTSPKTEALRKRLRMFFDARNSLVHGGAPQLHPVGSAYLSEGVEEFREQWFEAVFIGIHIVLATVQEYVRRNWRDVDYREQPEGIPALAG